MAPLGDYLLASGFSHTYSDRGPNRLWKSVFNISDYGFDVIPNDGRAINWDAMDGGRLSASRTVAESDRKGATQAAVTFCNA